MQADPINRWRAKVMEETARALDRRARPIPRICTVCGRHGLFDPFGWPVRPQAKCPQCGSLERHRLLKLWCDAFPGELRGKSVLHFAPEAMMVALIKPLASEYVSADLEARADLQLDI